MSELTPDDLIKAWQMQDEISDIATKMLQAGIELGVRQAGIQLMETYMAKDGELGPKEFEDAMDKAEKITKEITKEIIEKRINDVRGS